MKGPIVDDIGRFVQEAIGSEANTHRWWGHRSHRPAVNQQPGDAQALFVYRDNDEHRDDIEMLGNAKEDVIIATAYFFPGYRLLREMKNAAQRGVRVRLIVQGEPDMPIVKVGAELLYNYLVEGGVEVYEYIRRPLHGKVAVADRQWATVGSSNLDPLSLSLNLEANLIIHDRQFNQTLRDNLLLAAPDSGDEALCAVLKQVGLEKLLSGNEGLNAWLGEGGRQLSGGELRRLAIARALLHKSPIMLLDEPTEGLDAETEKHILALLARLTADKTVIVVTHRLQGLSEVDRIYVMDEGEIIEQGSHHELLSKRGRYWHFQQRITL